MPASEITRTPTGQNREVNNTVNKIVINTGPETQMNSGPLSAIVLKKLIKSILIVLQELW